MAYQEDLKELVKYVPQRRNNYEKKVGRSVKMGKKIASLLMYYLVVRLHNLISVIYYHKKLFLQLVISETSDVRHKKINADEYLK